MFHKDKVALPDTPVAFPWARWPTGQLRAVIVPGTWGARPGPPAPARDRPRLLPSPEQRGLGAHSPCSRAHSRPVFVGGKARCWTSALLGKPRISSLSLARLSRKFPGGACWALGSPHLTPQHTENRCPLAATLLHGPGAFLFLRAEPLPSSQHP